LRLPAEIVRLNPGYQVKLAFEDMPEDEKDMLVFGNETLLLTAIKNIVVNACKYSADHTANVGLRVSEDQLAVSVEDKGIGIPEEKLTTIFQPFYRVEENSNAEGFGLGL